MATSIRGIVVIVGILVWIGFVTPVTSIGPIGDPIVTTVTRFLEMMVVITFMIPPDPMPVLLGDVGTQETLFLLLLGIRGRLPPGKT